MFGLKFAKSRIKNIFLIIKQQILKIVIEQN